MTEVAAVESPEAGRLDNDALLSELRVAELDLLTFFIGWTGRAVLETDALFGGRSA